MSDRDALFASLYDELHRLAQAHVRRSAGPVTLSATTLLPEAYRTSLHEAEAPAVPVLDFDRLAGALDELGALYPALAELVDLKFFCGFSFTEIAAMRQVSERTVQRDWAKARAVLHDTLDES